MEKTNKLFTFTSFLPHIELFLHFGKSRSPKATGESPGTWKSNWTPVSGCTGVSRNTETPDSWSFESRI